MVRRDASNHPARSVARAAAPTSAHQSRYLSMIASISASSSMLVLPILKESRGETFSYPQFPSCQSTSRPDSMVDSKSSRVATIKPPVVLAHPLRGLLKDRFLHDREVTTNLYISVHQSTWVGLPPTSNLLLLLRPSRDRSGD